MCCACSIANRNLRIPGVIFVRPANQRPVSTKSEVPTDCGGEQEPANCGTADVFVAAFVTVPVVPQLNEVDVRHGALELLYLSNPEDHFNCCQLSGQMGLSSLSQFHVDQSLSSVSRRGRIVTLPDYYVRLMIWRTRQILVSWHRHSLRYYFESIMCI